MPALTSLTMFQPLTHDAAMADVTRDAGAGVVLMHRQGTPRTMQQAPQYGDVSAEVNGYLARRVEALVQSGSPRQTLAVDPGIGFGKTVEHNVALIQSLPDRETCSTASSRRRSVTS